MAICNGLAIFIRIEPVARPHQHVDPLQFRIHASDDDGSDDSRREHKAPDDQVLLQIAAACDPDITPMPYLADPLASDGLPVACGSVSLSSCPSARGPVWSCFRAIIPL